ncbi:hypothetical protein B0H10DRAFT_1942654 [Mycena sp. CBHHK59/15]|nr:hypothetical protein B0H10DRAFT_1942654 [Mycena sp. CBHHK59/15]
MPDFWMYFHKGGSRISPSITPTARLVSSITLTVSSQCERITQGPQVFEATCEAVGATRVEKTAWIAHLIGGKVVCPHASDEAKAYTTAWHKELQEKEAKKHAHSPSPSNAPEPPPKKQQLPSQNMWQKIQSTLTKLVFCWNDMPFSKAKADTLQKQVLHAVVSSGVPLSTFEDPEMKILFSMLHTTAPDIIPTGKVLRGRLLNNATAEVEVKTEKVLKNQKIGLFSQE